jgi:hypothetical protein
MGEISYVRFLGEGHDLIYSQELHKLIPGLLGGSFILSLSLTLVLIIFMFLVTSLIFH